MSEAKQIVSLVKKSDSKFGKKTDSKFDKKTDSKFGKGKHIWSNLSMKSPLLSSHLN